MIHNKNIKIYFESFTEFLVLKQIENSDTVITNLSPDLPLSNLGETTWDPGFEIGIGVGPSGSRLFPFFGFGPLLLPLCLTFEFSGWPDLTSGLSGGFLDLLWRCFGRDWLRWSEIETFSNFFSSFTISGWGGNSIVGDVVFSLQYIDKNNANLPYLM